MVFFKKCLQHLMEMMDHWIEYEDSNGDLHYGR